MKFVFLCPRFFFKLKSLLCCRKVILVIVIFKSNFMIKPGTSEITLYNPEFCICKQQEQAPKSVLNSPVLPGKHCGSTHRTLLI